MNVLILTGSPHPKGTSSYLVENYVEGLKEAGHSALIIDTARLNIRPCAACGYCTKNDGECVYKDDMARLYPHLMDADRVVLITPLYYFGMTAHLKTVIDRFFAINSKLRASAKELDLLAVCADDYDWAMDALILHYKALGKYLNWRCLPPLLARGFSTREEIEKTTYGKKAKQKAQCKPR